MCKSLVREHQGLGEEQGGDMGGWGRDASMWSSSAHGRHGHTGRPRKGLGLNRRGALVQEGTTIHSISAREAGMSVQGILGVSALRPRI